MSPAVEYYYGFINNQPDDLQQHSEPRYISMDKNDGISEYEQAHSHTMESEFPSGDESQDQPPYAAADDSVSTTKWSYFKSTDFGELVASVIFFLACLCIYSGRETLLYQGRPIPVQYLENINEYVVDLTFDSPVVPETVSLTALWTGSLLAPYLLQSILSQIKGYRHVGDTHGTACVYLVAIGLTEISTEAIKLYVGYLRPIFISECEPSEDYQTCTNDASTAYEYRKSFVSGHASTAFCGFMLLTRYIHERFGVPGARRRAMETGRESSSRLDPRPYTRRMYFARFVSLLSLLPLAVAVFIASSRIRDNRHFPADVVGGALLGASIALFVHGLWFE